MHILRQLLSFCLVIFTITEASAQADLSLHLRSTGQKIQDFVPENWEIVDSALGDLNHDREPDRGILLLCKDSITVSRKAGEKDSTMFIHPRKVVVLLKDDSNHFFRLVAQSDRFIPGWNESNKTNPEVWMEIRNGKLFVNFIYHYGVTNDVLSYSFLHRNNDFFLVGVEDIDYNPATGDHFNNSFNFMTRKWSESSYADTIRVGQIREKWHPIHIEKLKTLGTIGEQGTWEVAKNTFL